MEEIVIGRAVPEDAAQMVKYLKHIGKESDNLTFGEEGLPVTVEQEAELIGKIADSGRELMLVARRGSEIIGNAHLSVFPRRMSHRGELGISVRKPEWNRGVGTRLMEEVIAHAKKVGIEVISLEVRSDNLAAIRLYKKFGFQKIGFFPGYFKIGEAYVDFDLMNLYLK